MNGYRTLLLNLVAFLATYVASAQFGFVLDPVWVALIVSALNVAKRYLAPTVVTTAPPAE